MNSTPLRRVAALGIAISTLLVATFALAGPANATAYRYWSYWQGASGEWTAAQTGPGDYSLTDQDVQGWRFAISTEAVTVTPDNAPVFAALCPDLAGTAAPEGQVRVAVVIDSGYVADAPAGQTPPADVVSCVTVPEGSTGNQALAAAGSLRDDQGMVCAINGYPADACGSEVSDSDAAVAAEAASAEAPNPAVPATVVAGVETTVEAESSGAFSFALGAALLALLLGAAFAIPAIRRRNRSNPGA